MVRNKNHFFLDLVKVSKPLRLLDGPFPWDLDHLSTRLPLLGLTSSVHWSRNSWDPFFFMCCKDLLLWTVCTFKKTLLNKNSMKKIVLKKTWRLLKNQKQTYKIWLPSLKVATFLINVVFFLAEFCKFSFKFPFFRFPIICQSWLPLLYLGKRS